MESRLVVRLFGQPALTFDGKPWVLKAPRRSYGVMAMLALKGEPVPRSVLAATLWPDDTEDEARSKLRRLLHVMLRALPHIDGGDWIVNSGSTVAWADHAPVWIDVAAFVRGAKSRAQAIDVYRGELLQDWGHELQAERGRLQMRFVDLCKDEALAAHHRLDYDGAIRYVERVLAVDEWREDVVRLAMALRYEAGDRTSALLTFDTFAGRLRDEMGIDPMPETLALRDAILMNFPVPGFVDRTTEVSRDAGEPARSLFVGRQNELATMSAAWQRAAHGFGSTLFVVGRAGIGKSLLVSKFASTITGSGGARILIGQTSSPEAFPYEPFVDAFRSNLQLLVEAPLKGPWLSALGEVLHEIHGVMNDLPPVEPLPPDKARARLLEAIARTLEHIARTRALVLILEDLHWGQEATISALELLARRVGALPILLVVTYRSDETAGVERLRHALQREGRAESLPLAGLSVADVEELVRDLGRPPEFAFQLHTASEGHPLFLAQLLRGAAGHDAVLTKETTLASLTDVILARLSDLDERTRVIAETASVAGYNFTSPVVARVLGWSETEALDSIGGLLDRELVRASGRSAFSYSFTHALIADAIYERVAPDERFVRHRRLATVLSRLEDKEEHFASIARHWRLGGEPQKAGEYYMAAARAAFRTYAREEAIALARSSLELVDSPNDRYAMAELIALAERRTADRERWKSDLDALAAMASQIGDEQRFFAFSERALFLTHTGDPAGLRETIGEMLALASRLGPRERCLALLELGKFEWRHGQLAASLASLEESLALAAASSDRESESAARNIIARVLLLLGREIDARAQLEAQHKLLGESSSAELLVAYYGTEEHMAFEMQDARLALRAGDEMLALALRTGDRMLEINAHNLLAFSGQFLSSAPEVRRQLALAMEKSERIGLVRGAAIIRNNLATFELEVGFPERALELTSQALPTLTSLDERLRIGILQKNRAEAFLLLGDVDSAISCVEASRECAAAVDIPGAVVEAEMTFGSALCMAGEPKAGLPLMQGAVGAFRQSGPPAKFMEYLSRYVLAALDAEDAEHAVPAARELEALTTRSFDALYLWQPARVMLALARAAEYAGSASLAAHYFARGRDLVHTVAKRLAEEETARAFSALPFNKTLLSSAPRASDDRRTPGLL